MLEQDGFSQRTIDALLQQHPMEARDRAFTTWLVYGTLTWLGAIDSALAGCLRDGLGSVPADVRGHLRVAAAQLLFLNDSVPPRAAIHEAVELIGALHRGRYRGMSNAVLRRIDRERARLLADGVRTDPARWTLGLPDWLAERLERQLGPSELAALMRAANEPTPVWLRDRGRDSAALQATLAERGADPVAHPVVPGAWRIQGAVRLPGIIPELAVVQDAGAQAVTLAIPRTLAGAPGRFVSPGNESPPAAGPAAGASSGAPGRFVPPGNESPPVAGSAGSAAGPAAGASSGAPVILDACAGLGGKTLHLLDRFPAARVVAADVSARKLERIDAPGDRLARVAGDLRQASTRERLLALAPDGFDAVLLDAPCSALGTLARHPEIRWRRGEADVETMARVQSELIDACAELVRPGGWFVYAVCTFTPEETSAVAARIDADPRFQRIPLSDPSAARAPASAAGFDADRPVAAPAAAPARGLGGDAAGDGVGAGEPSGIDWAAHVDDSGAATLWPHRAHSDGFFVARWVRRDGA